MSQAVTEVTISVTMTAEVATQFAQFCKRSTFNTFYQCTEAHLPVDERNKRAYQMTSGLEAVQCKLAEAGYSPRKWTCVICTSDLPLPIANLGFTYHWISFF